jgi:hypothetical protein
MTIKFLMILEVYHPNFDRAVLYIQFNYLFILINGLDKCLLADVGVS